MTIKGCARHLRSPLAIADRPICCLDASARRPLDGNGDGQAWRFDAADKLAHVGAGHADLIGQLGLRCVGLGEEVGQVFHAAMFAECKQKVKTKCLLRAISVTASMFAMVRA